ncbi:MAG: hypothetical protein GY746_09405 [Gammaproteobacteria bacterium]|nr:hypothetical protein [Gammaproteobacteria bacterium]
MRLLTATIISICVLQACSDAGSKNDSNNTAQDQAGFPSLLSVNSPTSLSSTSARPRSRGGQAARSASATLTDIAAILSTPSALSTTIDMQNFYLSASDAQECYGPVLDFEDHPDSSGGLDDGQLPSGDLGIWKETVASGEACAAAQLNSQLTAIEQQTSLSLAVLAAMKSAYDSSGSADISSYLPAGVTWVSHTFAFDSVTNVTEYAVELGYDTNGDGTDEAIEIELLHAQDSSDDEIYEGLLTIRAADTFTGGNCGSGLNDISRYTSVHYIQNSANDLRLQARSGNFCGTNSTSVASHDAFSEAVSAIDTRVTGDMLNPAKSWADDFRVFTAEYDPTPDTSGELEGRYTLTWQAGSGDSHSRILDVGLGAGSGGESWFGFGNRVQVVNTVNEFGVIEGMICNWAGPKTTPMIIQDFAQRQHMTLDTSLSLYIPSNAGASDITYAPTQNCMYDGSGTFLYDRNLNSTLDEPSTDLLVGVGYGTAGTGLEFDLMDVGTGRTDIWDTITTDRNFTLPAYPN